MGRDTVIEFVPQSDEFIVQQMRVAKAGVEYDPTSDSLQFLVNTTGASPTTADASWTNGDWDTFVSGQDLLAMIDPTDLSLTDDTLYFLFMKIVDSPEVSIIRHIGFLRAKSSWA